MNQQTTQAMPQFALPDDQTFEKVTAEQTGGNEDRVKLPYLKILGPQGESSWSGLPIGYEGSAIVWLCPPFSGQQSPFYKYMSHFLKTPKYPKGIGFMHPGEDCRYCSRSAQLVTQGAASPEGIQRLQSFGKVRTQYLWNVILLNNLAGHQQADGSYRPFVLAAGYYLNEALRSIIITRGVANVLHPTHGRPIRITKKKTGYSNTDVQYGAIDLNPQPLDPQYYPVLANLWDFSQALTPTDDTFIDSLINELIADPTHPPAHDAGFQQNFQTPVNPPAGVTPAPMQQGYPPASYGAPGTGQAYVSQPSPAPVPGYQQQQTQPVSAPPPAPVPQNQSATPPPPPPPPVAGADLQALQSQVVGK